MIRFESDYLEGMHPLILKKIIDTNMEQTAGYGNDPHCQKAKNLIKSAIKNNSADVHFLVGGTQTNTTIISSVLRPYQGVLAADTGHINVHETGAIEAAGHKVLVLPSKDGTITGEQVAEYCDAHYADADHEHIVQPGMVYISFPTENGTLYTKTQLKKLYKTCRKYKLPLFIDGARLGYGLMSPKNTITLPELAKLCDVFYIGGTKVGAMMGEAVVIMNKALKKDFRYYIKQRGGMLAKGRLLGIQFETLFTDNLYFDIANHAIIQAMRIREAFRKKGYSFLYQSYTNQQYPILPNAVLDSFSSKYSFAYWSKVNETHSALRFCTSWATKAENVDALIRDINILL